MVTATRQPLVTPDTPHDRKVARIVAALRAHTGSVPVSLRKKTVAHQVPKASDLRRRDDKIDVGDLTEILEIDPVRRICVAESGVTFVDLVDRDAAARAGPDRGSRAEDDHDRWRGVGGCSIESMSFVHGGFHDTCLEYEVITARGEVLACTPDNEHHLVFQMMHGSFGTLGILSKLTFKLIPAKPFVQVVYETLRDRSRPTARRSPVTRSAATSTSWMASSTRPTEWCSEPGPLRRRPRRITSDYELAEGLLPAARRAGPSTT